MNAGTAIVEPEDSSPEVERPLVIDRGKEPIPGYRLIRMIGEGGFGQVWKAEAPGGFKVALKFIRIDTRQADPEIRSLEAIREIRHPFLLDIHFATKVRDRLIIATSLCDQSLLDCLQQRRKKGKAGLRIVQLLRYMKETAIALDFLNEPRHLDAHGKRIGIQHRDIKPHNIFLAGGSVKVADFGLAKVLENTLGSHTGNMTPVYAAPEMFRGRTSTRSDQYSLAVTYYQLRTGHLPYQGNHHELVYRVLQSEPDLSRVTPEEQQVLKRALAKRPSHRWATCREFVDELRRGLRRYEKRRKVGPSRLEDSGAREAAQQELDSDSSKSTDLRPCSDQKSSSKHSHPPFAMFPFSTPKANAYQRLWAKYLGMDVVVANRIRMPFALIPPGEFRMGETETLESQHSRQIPTAFLLGVYQVTVREFAYFVKTTNYVTDAERDGRGAWGYNRHLRRFEGRNPKYNWKNVGWKQSPEHPVVNVTWNDASAFCCWLSELEDIEYRLPSEVEWEYACRAGTKTQYSFGDEVDRLRDHANVADQALHRKWAPATWAQPWDNNFPFTAPVGRFHPNAFGLHDMHGNVWEWCLDWYERELSSWDTPVTEVKDGYRVVRGGSWLDLPQLVRSSDRQGLEPETRYCNNGFRVLRKIRHAEIG